MKPKRLLISITPRDLGFIVEENLSGIFSLFALRNVRIDLMQNSAVAFSVAVDDTPCSRQLIEELGSEYEVRYNDGCELLTVRHYDEATLERLTKGKGSPRRRAQPGHRAFRVEVGHDRRDSLAMHPSSVALLAILLMVHPSPRTVRGPGSSPTA